uniref:Calponin-homology (CH) domain-containing protein n=1 Tax=Caenorhabditis tropicalis TaxID=1561998 RepID=A0A1I7TCF8_9PELO
MLINQSTWNESAAQEMWTCPVFHAHLGESQRNNGVRMDDVITLGALLHIPSRRDIDGEHVDPGLPDCLQNLKRKRGVNRDKAGDSIGSLEKDLSDGLKLIGLAQVLSLQTAFRSLKLDIYPLALNFFQSEKNIKSVDIG